MNIPIRNEKLNNSSLKILNNNFSELINQQEKISSNVINIEDFFSTYEDLFFSIPKEGENNSHSYILNRTLEYLNINLNNDNSIKELLIEITQLKKDLLDANTLISNLNDQK